MPMRGEALLTPAVNYVRFLIFNQELNSREVQQLPFLAEKTNNLLFKINP